MKKIQQKKNEATEKKTKKDEQKEKPKSNCYPNQYNVTNISYNQVNNFINPINAVFIQNGFIVNGNIFYGKKASYYGKFNNSFINIVPKCIQQANNYNIVQNSVYENKL